LSLDVSTGGQGLAGLDDIEVLGIDVRVSWQIVLLGGNENTLAEEVLMDLLAVGLWDKPEIISKLW
jgi:hypothetical protein